MNFPIQHFDTLDTPFYYYDIDLLRRTLRALRAQVATTPGYHIHYAVKANANPRILAMIALAGLGADCVSGGEIEAACRAGFAPEQIVFAGVGKSDREILTALRNDIFCFNVESVAELEVINRLAASEGVKARVAFRVNPNVDAHTHAKITTGLNENKFGIALEDVVPTIRMAAGMEAVEYMGLHFHIGSQILDLDVYRNLCLRINELQDILDREGIITQHINVGGGLGIDYEQPDQNPIPDFASYFAVFRQNLVLRPGQQVHFEPGRSLVAQCGTLVSRTLYVKVGHTRKFVIVDAGFTDLIRPALYDAHHCTQNLSAPNDASTDTYDVVGPICESSDVFSTDEVLPVTKRGDLIAFRSAGAYGEVMASQYNCRALPRAVYSDDRW